MWELHLIHWIKSEKNKRFWVYSHIHLCREHDESFPLQLSKFQLCDKGITVLYFYVKVFYFQKLLKLHHKSWCIYKDMRYLIGRVSWHNYTTAKAEGKIKKKASIQPSQLSLPTANFIANLIYLTQGARRPEFFSLFFLNRDC